MMARFVRQVLCVLAAMILAGTVTYVLNKVGM